MIHFPKPDVDQFFRTYSISNFAVSHDESKLIFSTNLNGIINLWAIDFPRSFPYQFALHDQQCNVIKFDRTNRFVVAGFDHDGDENYHIYALPFEGGKPQPLITGNKEDKFYLTELSKDGKSLFYNTSKDNPSFLNSCRYNLETKEHELLHQGNGSPTYLSAVAPNQNEFLTVQMMSNTYAITYLHTKGERISLTPDPDKDHIASDAVFANDSTIFFVTDYDQEFAYIAKYDIPSKEFTPVLRFENESVSTIKWHEASKTLWVKTEKGVQDSLYTYSIEDEQLTKIDKPFDLLDQLTVAESGTVYALGKSATLPLNIFRKKAGEQWEAITSNKVLGVAEDQMVNSNVITYRSFDGMNIEAQLFRANKDQANGYTIFWPHGGPQSAERKSFRALFQCLLNRGYNIFAPNFRGSTGYGSSFTKLVEGDWGEGPRLDCVAGMDWLFDNNISSKEKLFVVGGSYGGYMTLLLAGRHHDYFRAAVDIFGPSNLFTFVNSVPEHWKPLMKRWLGDPIEDKERLVKDSPITYLEQMKKPMLVIQGANDPRVIKAESDQIVEALRSNGLSVEYLVLDDEGHGFSKKANEIKVYEMILEFLAKHH